MSTVAFLTTSNISIPDALLYAVVGFVIVLAVLALLVGIFYALGAIFKTKAMSKDKLFERKKKPKANTVADDTDEQAVAAIMAAVSCMLQAESADDVQPEFVIRRIKRKK